MSSKNFIRKIYKHNSELYSNLPDKELTFQFINKLFEFLFLPKKGVNLSEIEIEKGLYSLKNHLITLLYEISNNGNKSQETAETFFSELPAVYDL